MTHKNSQQRVAEAAIKFAANRSNGVLSVDTCLSIALGQVTKWVNDQDDCISAERVVFIARKASELIYDHYRNLASL